MTNAVLLSCWKVSSPTGLAGYSTLHQITIHTFRCFAFTKHTGFNCMSTCTNVEEDHIAQGNYDPLLAGSRRKESAEVAAARLKEEGAQARSAVGYLALFSPCLAKQMLSVSLIVGIAIISMHVKRYCRRESADFKSLRLICFGLAFQVRDCCSEVHLIHPFYRL